MAKKKRLYSLFRRKREIGARWERCGAGSYHEEYAIRLWQTRMLNSAFGLSEVDRGYELRLMPIKVN